MKAAVIAAQGLETDREAPGGFVPPAEFEPPGVPRDEWFRHVSARLLVLYSVLWSDPITNRGDGERTMQSVAEFFRQPRHDAARLRSAFQDVALTSAFLDDRKPIVVVLAEEPQGAHHKIRAYPFDMRDQFPFVSDLTVRGKLAIAEAGAAEAVSGTLASN